MAKRTARTSKIFIPTRRAHTALQLLLDQLALADTSDLEPQNRGKGAKTTKVDEWEEALRTAMLEIEEWCPSFSLELNPKPRERRSRSTRK